MKKNFMVLKIKQLKGATLWVVKNNCNTTLKLPAYKYQILKYISTFAPEKKILENTTLSVFV